MRPLSLRLSFLLLLLTTLGRAERLPVKVYTTADGLARDTVLRIVPDSRGFLWFCTNEGLSRFDGYGFVNFNQGLPGRAVSAIVELKDGLYLVATNQGLCWFNAKESRGASQPVFLVDAQLGAAKGLNITDLVVSRSGAVWCSSSTNLFRIERTGGKWVSSEVDLSAIQAHARLYELRSLLEDRRGALWMVTTSGLYRRSLEGKIDHFGLAEGIPENTLSYAALLEDAEGHIWVGTDRGLYRLLDDPVINRNAVARIYTTRDGLGSNHIAALLQTLDGNLWIATGGGLSQSIGSANNTDLEKLRFRNFTQANGVPGVGRMTTDHNGNLWMGAESVGAIKIALHGFTNFDQTDGLARSRIASLLMARDGSLCAMTVDSEQNRAFINRLKGDRYEPIELRRPPGVDHWGWGWYQIMFQSHLSEWWMLTGKGIVRYPSLASMNALASARPQAFYTGNDTVGEQPFRAFEDSRGDVWIGAFTQGLGTLSRWESKTGTFHQYGPSEGISQRSVPSAFGEDNAGNVWVGFYEGGVARYGSGGFKVFEPESGFPSGLVRAVFLDRANRIWIATGEGGAVRIDDPAGHPDRFVTYNTTNGLSSNQATCFTEDKWGRIYIGTGRGVDRLEVATGKLRHYSTADGLANNFPQVALQDRDGALWFGTLQGLSRLIPQSEPPGLPPPIMISELRVGGAPHPVSAVGEIDISDLVLEPDRNQILVGFLGLSFGLGELLRYQYKLEGASTEWSAPGAQRVVNFANLAPGAYRFLVRAVNADGVVSAAPASVSLRVLPPVWRRWWFLTIAAIAFAAPLLAFISYRQRRMRELDSALRESRSLADKLLEQRRDLHNANEILKLEATITRVLGESSTPREASPRLLRAICETTGWQLGAIWELDRASGALQCTDTWHPRETRALAFEAASKSRAFGPGVGLPGRVLASGQPVWISDLSHDDNFPRLTAAAKDGWRSGFGFPILLGSEVIGALEFFSLEVREPDAEQIKMMSSIGSHLGQLIERKRAEEARHETETRFRTVAETASDAIMTIDESGHIIFVNQSCEQVFGHKTEEMIGRELTMLMPEYLRHLHEAGFARYKETGQRHLNWNSLELPGLHRDGHEIPLEISFGEFVHQGRRYFTGIARDVSERKRAEEALRRSREERLEELERVRRRIATDLHDDIGSSLTQISILGEVLRRRLGQEDAGTNDLLTMIAGESREMVDSMSDIVWAINPQKDHLSDLTQRMRRFAVDAYTARNIRLDLQLPAAEDENIKMGANLRREVFLIFKESINNTIKHAGCTETKIDMQIADQILLLTLRDNGCGFDTTQQSDGHGLLSLRERAQGIGGDIEIDSAPGRGTTIVLRAPIAT